MTAPAAATDPLLQLAAAGGVFASGEAETGRTETHRELGLLAARFQLEFVDLVQMSPQPEALRLVPRTLAARHLLLPLARTADTLRVAIGDPLDTDGTDCLAHQLGLNLEMVLAAPAEIRRAIDRYYGRETGPVDELLIHRVDPEMPSEEFTSASEESADAPVIRLVHELIAEAVRRRASDIHLEPLERRFRVRYRIDGVLQESEGPPKRLQLAIISRLKIMANISIAEKRLPQDGRIRITSDGRSRDLRVSTLPTAHGESLVMRILDRENLKPGLSELGLMDDDRALLERMIRLPDGIVLVTGPTGSGKTTTLYAGLHQLNQSDRKIITVEDPVEYQLSGVNQVPVKPEVGLTFASALRAMLRQAPNVIMVGEIRDLETAEIAINASLTGHMVFSTLHTNDAPGAVTRLIELGAKPYLVSTSLRGVVAQRLVRRICPACSRPHVPTVTELHLLGLNSDQVAGAHFRRGTGCPECRGTGYRGRLGLFEILDVSAPLRAMIHPGTSAARLRARARAEGMRTLREDGLRKIIAGLTTVEEVVSMTAGEVV